MASAQAPGTLKFYRQTPTGSRVFLYGNAVAALGPSGSSDGAIASTPEKWVYIPVLNAGNKVLQVNDKLVVTYTASAAVTIDASDCQWIIPVTLRDGSVMTLEGPDSVTDWDGKQAADEAYVAGRETILCEKVVRQPFALGSNSAKAFASIENNA